MDKPDLPLSKEAQDLIRRAKTKMADRSMTVRVSHELYQQLADLAAQFNAEMPGRITTVSDVARSILQNGVNYRRKAASANARIEAEVDALEAGKDPRRRKKEGILTK
jgi:hypothetical protein